MRLWEYRYRERENWEEPQSVADLLREVYAVEGPEDLLEVVVAQSPRTSPTLVDKALWIEPRTIRDRESVETVYAILCKLSWTGSPSGWKDFSGLPAFPRYTYSFTPEDGELSDAASYLNQRRLTLVFADGTTMEDWYYTASSGYLERAYGHGEHIQPDEPLPPEEVFALNALFGIA